MSSMNILIVGNGGREHALAWKIKQSKLVNKVFLAPFARRQDGILSANININNFSEISMFSKNNSIDLVVIGPEKPLSDGLSDYLQKQNILVFGANKQAAQLESSKIFAKQFMKKYQIPTADFHICENFKDAKQNIEHLSYVPVVKVDGLAAGKGVLVAKNKQEAVDFAQSIFDGKFGKNQKLILERQLHGAEVSIFAMLDGKNYVLFKPSQDHKRLLDFNNGPNTGGMGAFAPVYLPEQIEKYIKNNIIKRVLYGLNQENIDFRGLLYIGLIIYDNKVYVLEFNVRFGDPETQPLMMLLKNDIVPYLYGVAKGELPNRQLLFNDAFAVTIVMAAPGYPDNPIKNLEIQGLENIRETSDLKIFHSGTKYQNGKFYTDGGRVLSVGTTAKTLKEAINSAYRVVEQINWQKATYRKDIGKYGQF